jgi:HYR domain
MKAPLLFAAVLVTLAIGATAAVGATRSNMDSIDALQVNSTLFVKFDPADCLPGVPATTVCFQGDMLGRNVIPGLGAVTAGPGYHSIWEGFGSPCGSFHQQIPLLVAGKGEIDLTVATSGCWTSDNFPLATLAVTGGTGTYAGATGAGTLEFHLANINGPLSGNRNITWTGTLKVPGLAFDTTPPVITGATSKVVKTRLAKGARVTYAAKATDATDGILAPACLPKSGSLFAVGRTTVTCDPTDNSGNPATARFVITVKRVR